MDNLLTEVQEIFRSVFDSPDLEITPQSNAHNVDGWDSIVHISIVMALEKRYKVKFGLGQLQDLEDVGDLLNLLKSKIAAARG
jgi:acyl carrier protein